MLKQNNHETLLGKKSRTFVRSHEKKAPPQRSNRDTPDPREFSKVGAPS